MLCSRADMGTDSTREPFSIREGRDADSAAVIRLVADCFAEYPGCVLDVEREEPELLAPASSFDGFWVAEADGEVIGCVALSLAEERPVLKKMYLRADRRGTGIGEELEAQVLAAAHAAGASRIELWSDTRFARAHRFYERGGWRRTGRTRELHDLSATTEYHFERTL